MRTDAFLMKKIKYKVVACFLLKNKLFLNNYSVIFFGDPHAWFSDQRTHTENGLGPFVNRKHLWKMYTANKIRFMYSQKCCSKIGGLIVGIYKSLTDTWMWNWKRGRTVSFLGIFVSNSVQCLCSLGSYWGNFSLNLSANKRWIVDSKE